MKAFKLCFLLISLVSLSCTSLGRSAWAQSGGKNIPIDPILAANSEALKVRLNTKGPIKNWCLQFGDFRILIHEMNELETRESSNFLKTKITHESKDHISFSLHNNSPDSAHTLAISEKTVLELRSLEICRDFFWGRDDFLRDSHFLSAIIRGSWDKNKKWFLLMEQDYGRTNHKYEAFLGNDERIIKIIPLSSNSTGKNKRLYPALGYEFIENKEVLSAVQYHGGGALGLFKKTIWIKSAIDHRTKLILAAAMSALILLETPDYIEAD